MRLGLPGFPALPPRRIIKCVRPRAPLGLAYASDSQPLPRATKSNPGIVTQPASPGSDTFRVPLLKVSSGGRERRILWPLRVLDALITHLESTADVIAAAAARANDPRWDETLDAIRDAAALLRDERTGRRSRR